ncbi:MAG: META domain-containing protein [Hyphomonas sp.]
MTPILFRRTLLLPILLAGATALSGCITPPMPDASFEAASLVVTGSATYRERMAAPKGSVLKVELSDTSRADAPAISLADWSDSLDDGGVPKRFTLRVNDTLDPRMTYTLRATVKGPDGTLLWTTDTVHRLSSVSGNVNAGELVMVKVAPAPAPQAMLLTGKDWTIASIGGEETKGPRPLSIRFDKEGRASGFSGCNSFGGGYEESAGKVTFSPLASTLMACIDETLGQQEGALHDALKGELTVATAEGGKVVLTGRGGTEIVMKPTAEAPELAATSWLVETMGGTAIVAGHEPQISFSDDGQISGTTGCNRFFGAYAQTGTRVAFFGVGMTKMACLDDGVMAQEIAFGAILSGAAEASIDAHGNLTIRAENGISFTARSLPAETPEGDPAVLTGAAWRVEDINRGGIIDNSNLTLTFGEDGTLTGSTHCNNLSGGYTATGTTITFTPIRTTLRACTAESLGHQEGKFIEALSGDMNWRQTPDGAIELTREFGHRVLLRR